MTGSLRRIRKLPPVQEKPESAFSDRKEARRFLGTSKIEENVLSPKTSSRADQEIKVFLLLFLQKKKNLSRSFLKKGTKRHLSINAGEKNQKTFADQRWFIDTGYGRRGSPRGAMHFRGALVVFALSAGAFPAFGYAQPVVRPLHDVDITYKIPVQGFGQENLLQRYRWSASLQTQRVDMPTSGNWMMLDYRDQRMALVRDESKEVVDLPAPLTAAQPGAGAGYSRLGPATVAGLACTEWRTVDTRGQETDACYTDDGILLRARSGTRILMEALSVKYVAQPAGIFTPPRDYSHRDTSR